MTTLTTTLATTLTMRMSRKAPTFPTLRSTYSDDDGDDDDDVGVSTKKKSSTAPSKVPSGVLSQAPSEVSSGVPSQAWTIAKKVKSRSKEEKEVVKRLLVAEIKPVLQAWEKAWQCM